MKYKPIDSVLHNFGHSFVSPTNYVDDVYICDLLDAAARDSGRSEVQINFSGEVADLPEGSAPALKKSFEFSKAWLPKLLEGQRGACPPQRHRAALQTDQHGSGNSHRNIG